jgi:membrane-associated phospholipid phosphatase
MLIAKYMFFITSFGNAAVVGALVVTTAVYLVMAGCRRPALAVALTFVLAASGATIAKLLCMGCPVNSLDPALHSPSGHVAISTAVYGMMTTIIAAQTKGWQRRLVWAAGFLLIALIAASRVLLRFHTFDEVMVGLVIGGVSYEIVRRFVLRNAVVRFNGWAFATTALVVVFLFHNMQIPFEQAIQWLAQHIRAHIAVC